MQPARNPKSKAARPARSSRPAGPTRPIPTAWIPLLHVEDDLNDRDLLQAAVSEAGVPFRVFSAIDAEMAMGYLSGAGIYSDRSRYPVPSLILLDLKMRRVNGIELLKWMRAQPDLAHCPVIVLSGSALEEDVRQVYACGADAFIVKPLGFYALVELVNHLNFSWFVAPQNGPTETNRLFPV
jgi:CheY-like chemotaxis protein